MQEYEEGSGFATGMIPRTAKSFHRRRSRRRQTVINRDEEAHQRWIPSNNASKHLLVSSRSPCGSISIRYVGKHIPGTNSTATACMPGTKLNWWKRSVSGLVEHHRAQPWIGAKIDVNTSFGTTDPRAVSALNSRRPGCVCGATTTTIFPCWYRRRGERSSRSSSWQSSN